MYNNLVNTIGFLKDFDPEVSEAMNDELKRQRRNLELIASENIVSPAVMAAMGSVLTNKYAEGYPAKRYYGGCQCVVVISPMFSPIREHRQILRFILRFLNPAILFWE